MKTFSFTHYRPSHFSRRATISLATPPSYNPQNTPQPLHLPDKDLSPEQAVATQLDALADNDNPFPQHGIHTLYEWGYDIGGLDPSMYFGFKKDLYHLDHFQGYAQNKLPELINLKSYSIGNVQEVEDSDGDMTWIVTVSVLPSVPSVNDEETVFEFHLKRKKVGARKGALMTAMVLKKE